MARDEAGRQGDGVCDPTRAALAPLLAAARGALARGDAIRALESVEWLLDEARQRFADEERAFPAWHDPHGGAHAADHEALVALLAESVRCVRSDGRWEGVHHLAAALDGWFDAHALAFHTEPEPQAARAGGTR